MFPVKKFHGQPPALPVSPLLDQGLPVLTPKVVSDFRTHGDNQEALICWDALSPAEESLELVGQLLLHYPNCDTHIFMEENIVNRSSCR